ncbi:monovalent cation/H+ antiporter subunit D family protein [Egibacter rhizosphaerae]|uniref:Monovalent cation/H+ antiporter subunit D family protein n=1 Tax=Egibacter rhizosphaerae TaxID=1670831 RepID=A0A411YJP0_9ACTN|nr:proton-conducting transporter membrane subunit [Egibacter rhizosphaerae]QBI21412.1 monovalent cation/H+ antiporter subunit D family protein [Egibacter rhizosphaerae]
MTAREALPLLLVATSLVPALVVFALPERARVARDTVTLLGAGVKLVLVLVLLLGVFRGATYEVRWAVLPDLAFVLRVEEVPLLFLTLSVLLWFATTVYTIGYLAGDAHLTRFFGYFNLCVAATMGIGLAGNLFTFLIFYELLTVSTFPLVVHEGTADARAGGRAYLAYAVGGGSVLFVAMVWLALVADTIEFSTGGVLADAAAAEPGALTAIFALLVIGLGVKAALVPLHGWLPQAMVAPTPVSALLHAVAVVKAGAYGLVRVVLDLYGPATAAALGVLTPLAVVAAVTLLWGSVRAIGQDGLKARLAYSTVAQLAFVAFGVAVGGPGATAAGLVHLVHQGLMKVTLFYCVGALGKELGVHRASELDGTARRMPVTMSAFALAALAMVGVPPLAGFVTKWHLGVGAVAVGAWWVPVVLAASTLLTAAYVLPLVHAAWFRPPRTQWPPRHARFETRVSLLAPIVAVAASVALVGTLAGAPFSPFGWSELIVEQVFGLEQGDARE